MINAYGVKNELRYCPVRSIVKNATTPTERNAHTVIDQWNNASLDGQNAYAMRALENKNDYVSGADSLAHRQVHILLFIVTHILYIAGS